MEKKKGSSVVNIFVYLIMILLVLVVILPPVFRVVFKETETVLPQTSETATALTCRKEVMVGSMTYNISIVSNYSNETLNKVTFTYKLPEVIDNTVTSNPVVDEINYVRNTGIVDEEASATQIKFILTRENREANPTNTNLSDFFNDLQTQESYITSLGYSCSKLTV